MHERDPEPGRIGALAALKARLGEAGTIVCLGNGPSSEDPRLADFADALLFRVNWIWLARGWMTEPDAVFTADADLVRPRREPVVLYPTEALGAPILAAHAAAGRRPHGGYAFLDRFDPPVADLSGPQIPTNGALMVALAARLAPRRIVVAGIDLYRHPKGRYPGVAEDGEGYAAQHRAGLDVALIRRALGAWGGEAVLLSDNLRTALGD